MNKKLFTPFLITIVIALLVSACQGGQPPAPTLSAADLRSTASALEMRDAQVAQACGVGNVEGVVIAGTPYPCPAGAAPTTAPVSVAPTAGPSGNCDPLSVTSLPERPDAVVNGTQVTLQVRDTNQCGRPLWYNETGIDDPSTVRLEGDANYTLTLPEGWTAITASRTAEVQREGGQPKQFLDCPIVVVNGPFTGGIGLYEGAIRIVPNEWADTLLGNEVVPIQTAQCKKTVTPTVFK